MASRKKLTPYQQEYKKQINRLKRAVKRAEKKGYVFEENVVPEMPKRVTAKSLEKIKQTKPKELYKKAEWIDIDTGETMSGVERRKYERQVATERAKTTRYLNKIKREIENEPYDEYVHTISIIDRIRSYIQEIPSARGFGNTRKGHWYEDFEPRKNALLSILDDRFADEDEMDIAKDLLDKDELISMHIHVVTYDSDSDDVRASFVQLAILLKNSSLTHKEAEELHEMSEFYNG